MPQHLSIAGNYLQFCRITKNYNLIHIKKEQHMISINPHINFNGNAEEAFIFYKSIFGGEFAKIIRLKEISSPEFPVAENDKNKVLHIALLLVKTF